LEFFAGFFGPELGSLLLVVWGKRVGFDPAGGLAQEMEEGLEIFAVEEEPDFAEFFGLFVAFTFGENQVVVAVAGLFDLGGVGARADAFEEGLEEDFVV
jgi:hypothetical protein